MSDGLILIEKDGERIRVHPLSLENHLALGWTVVEELVIEAKTEKAEEIANSKPSGKRREK